MHTANIIGDEIIVAKKNDKIVKQVHIPMDVDEVNLGKDGFDAR